MGGGGGGGRAAAGERLGSVRERPKERLGHPFLLLFYSLPGEWLQGVRARSIAIHELFWTTQEIQLTIGMFAC